MLRYSIPFNNSTDKNQISIEDIWFAAQQVYAGHPELLEAAWQTLEAAR